jgi:DNA-binding Xre family transcriptional regulator
MTPIVVRLRELRIARGLSQQELSERAGVRQAAISELESGKRRRVDLEVLDRLCVALGVQPGELLERERRRKGK